MALQSCEVLDAMHQDANLDLRELRVDGGASRDDLLMQIQSDLLQRPVVRPRCVETTALGAAYLAGLATGVWKSQSEIARQWSVDARFTPGVGAAAIQPLLTGWRKAVERTKGWIEA